MCGIAGFVGLNDEKLLRRMCASLRHRGPDEDGFFLAPGVGLSSRRLAVIDLVTGRQPICNETRDVWVVFNGEIYNYTELRDDLIKRGHTLRTTSDTETIVHLYEEHGDEFVQRLRGMFAIALWDSRRRRLVLARDRIGEKPLYFARDGERLVFGSEAKAVLLYSRNRRTNPRAVRMFLTLGYVPAPDTFFVGIEKLPPGCLLVHENAAVSMRQYWQFDSARSQMPFNEASEVLERELSASVRGCLKSDVEVGVFLSGGLDSSIIAAMMSRHGLRPHSFTVGYTGAASGFNELGYAARVAGLFSHEHHELTISGHATIELLPRVIWHFDEPHGEPSSILVYLLCEFARQRLKVVLGGTGGDELFFGYPRHKGIRYLQYYRFLPRILRKRLVERVVMRWPESTNGRHFAKRARRFIAGSELSADEAYLQWVSLLNRDLRGQLLSAELAEAADDLVGENYLRAALTRADLPDLMDRAARLDTCGYLPEFQLAYMDRMSMAHGLEARAPLCDYRLAELALSLPPAFRLKGSRSKHILKSVARKWLPRAIVEREKVGFDSPIGQWAKGELREFLDGFFAPEHVKRSGLLRFEGVRQLLSDHQSGMRDHSLPIWSLLALETWHRMYIEDGVEDGSQYRLADLRGGAAAPNPGPHVRSQILPAVRRSKQRPGWARFPTRRHLWEQLPSAARRRLGRALGVLPPSLLLGARFRRTLRFARAAQWWSRERIRTHQLAQLQGLVRLAAERSEFYRSHFHRAGFDPAAFQSLQEFERLPTIDRHTLGDHLEQMRTEPPGSHLAEPVSTGGTGGEPLRFCINVDRSATEYAFLVASWERAGFSLGTSLAVLRGRVVPPQRDGLRHEFDPLLRHHYYSNFHTTDADWERYLRHMRGIGPFYLHVYPSSVAALARFLRRTGLPPPDNMLGLLAESEIVYPEQRRMVQETFDRRLFSCYGHTEKLVLAAACERSDVYHVWPTYGYFELLDAQGLAVTTPGERGEIVGTGFINTVMPFIRYRTGDFATYVADRCPACGRNHTLIERIEGHRIQEFLTASDGSQISWTALNMHDDTFDRVRRFQFVQDQPGVATLRIVPAPGFGEEDCRRILLCLARKLNNRVQVTIAPTDHIPLSARGKAIYVVSGEQAADPQARVTEMQTSGQG